MVQGLEVYDASGVSILGVLDDVTTLIKVVQVTTKADKEKPVITVKDDIFLTNTGFYIRNPEKGKYKTFNRGFVRIDHSVKETQVGNTYTVTFPELARGCDFTVYIGAY